MPRPTRRALIVSDSAPLRQYIASTLSAVDIDCTEAATGFHAMDRYAERLFDLYLIDLDMPSSDGLTIFAISLMGSGRDPSPTVIGLSATKQTPENTPRWADPSKIIAVLPKPFHPDELIRVTQAALGPASERKS